MNKAGLITLFSLAYATTFLGTWYQRDQTFNHYASNAYQEAIEKQVLNDKWCKRSQIDQLENTACLHQSALDNGPDHWSHVYPLLPLVSVVNSGYKVAPHDGVESIELVLWYFWGTFSVMQLSSSAT